MVIICREIQEDVLQCHNTPHTRPYLALSQPPCNGQDLTETKRNNESDPECWAWARRTKSAFSCPD